MMAQDFPPDRGSRVDEPTSGDGAEKDHEDRLIRRRDVAVGVILVGVVWSYLSFLGGMGLLVGDSVGDGAQEWAFIVTIFVAPITIVVALIGVVFRRRWVRWPAAAVTVALIGLWIFARIELAPYWSDPLFGFLSLPRGVSRGAWWASAAS